MGKKRKNNKTHNKTKKRERMLERQTVLTGVPPPKKQALQFE